LILVVFTTALAFAQQDPPAATTSPRFDSGQYAHDTYSNECLGFSFHMPEGWVAKSQGISGPARAIHQQGGGLGLLMIEQPKPGTFGNTITLYATAGSDQNEDAKEFVNHAIQAQTKHAPEKNEVLRAASALEYGSKKFFRSDYKAALPYGHTCTARSSSRTFATTSSARL
jgi:hypothetical protein